MSTYLPWLLRSMRESPRWGTLQYSNGRQWPNVDCASSLSGTLLAFQVNQVIQPLFSTKFPTILFLPNLYYISKYTTFSSPCCLPLELPWIHRGWTPAPSHGQLGVPAECRPERGSKPRSGRLALPARTASEGHGAPTRAESDHEARGVSYRG